jgi:hypothetical protein
MFRTKQYFVKNVGMVLLGTLFFFLTGQIIYGYFVVFGIIGCIVGIHTLKQMRSIEAVICKPGSERYILWAFVSCGRPLTITEAAREAFQPLINTEKVIQKLVGIGCLQALPIKTDQRYALTPSGWVFAEQTGLVAPLKT